MTSLAMLKRDFLSTQGSPGAEGKRGKPGKSGKNVSFKVLLYFYVVDCSL